MRASLPRAALDKARSRMTNTLTIPLFPLGTLLFPGGLLPLKLFEQRYLTMGKNCLRDATPFGVCGIKEGIEVGAPALPFSVGCIAKIVHWDMPQLGILHIVAEGQQRFRVVSHQLQSDGLNLAEIQIIPNDAPQALVDEFAPCAKILKAVMEGLGEQHFQPPFEFDNATWVGNRLAETLPLPVALKQQLLEMNDPSARLANLQQQLIDEGVIPS